MPALALPRGHALCGGLEKLGGCLGGVVQSFKQSSTNRTSPTKIRDVPAKNTTPCPIPPAPVGNAKWKRHQPATIISDEMTSPTIRRHFDRPCFLFIRSASVCTRDDARTRHWTDLHHLIHHAVAISGGTKALVEVVGD